MSSARVIATAAEEREGAQVPAAEIFLLLAEELERARVLGLRIEGAICSIAVRTELDAGLVSELQQLDAVLQHIAALRDYAAEVSRCSAHLPKVATESALDRVTLNEVRTRLAGDFFDDKPDDVWEMM